MEMYQNLITSTIQNGNPLQFRVTFPLRYPLPKLTAIYVNGQLVCSGVVDRSPQVSTLNLNYDLRTGIIINQVQQAQPVSSVYMQAPVYRPQITQATYRPTYPPITQPPIMQTQAQTYRPLTYPTTQRPQTQPPYFRPQTYPTTQKPQTLQPIYTTQTQRETFPPPTQAPPQTQFGPDSQVCGQPVIQGEFLRTKIVSIH